jgi:hypothetical protein
MESQTRILIGSNTILIHNTDLNCHKRKKVKYVPGPDDPIGRWQKKNNPRSKSRRKLELANFNRYNFSHPVCFTSTVWEWQWRHLIRGALYKFENQGKFLFITRTSVADP